MKLESFINDFSPIVKYEDAKFSDNVFGSIELKEFRGLWDAYGLASYGDGIFWTVNPQKYEWVIEELKEVNELFLIKGKKFYVFGRNSFGDIFFLIESKERNSIGFFSILYNDYSIMGDDDFDFFFNFTLNEPLTFKRELSQELFNQCKEKLGSLKSDECYGFSPLPALGGDKDIKHAEKVKLKEYLSICAQSHL